MAAGAILPPMFFERHRLVSPLAPSMACSQNALKTTSASPAHSTAGVIMQAIAIKSLPKEI
jgi:hypothetical protein